MVNPNQGEDRLIVGVSGASGIVFGIQALRALKTLGVESHLVASKAAEMTLGYETMSTRCPMSARRSPPAHSGRAAC